MLSQLTTVLEDLIPGDHVVVKMSVREKIDKSFFFVCPNDLIHYFCYFYFTSDALIPKKNKSD